MGKAGTPGIEERGKGMDYRHRLLRGLDEGCRKEAFFRAFFPILAFLLALSIAVLLFALNGFSPFAEGGHTMVMVDAQSEYVAYFRYLKTLLNGGENWLYTLSKAFGGNFLSIYTFYLASPFNLFVAFVPDVWIPSFMLFISVLRMALAGLFFYFFLRSTFGKDRFLYLLFSTSYGLCSYAFIYLFNLMWLDAVMVLPLVLLGLNHILSGKRSILYPLALCYALWTSWYTGFMVCVFVLLFFLAFFLAKGRGERDWSIVLSFVLLSVLGGFLAGAAWVTAFLHFAGTKAGGASFPDALDFNNLSTVLDGFLTNNYTSVSNINRYGCYASYFTSVPVLVFALLSFFSAAYPRRERVASLLLFLFYMLCVASPTLDTLMHGGAVPTWFPVRYGFVIDFLVCYLGARGAEGLKRTGKAGFALSFLALPVVLYIVVCSPNSLGETYAVSLAAVGIYLGTWLLCLVLRLLRLPSARLSAFGFSACSFLFVAMGAYSSYLSNDNILRTNIEEEQYQSQETYLADDRLQEDFDRLLDYDSSLCRMENTFLRDGSYNQTDNDPMFYRFNGISHYSSSEIKDVMAYDGKLGFHYNGFFEGYDGGSTLAMNSYLGIKYIVDGGKGPAFLDKLERVGLPSQNGLSFYRNTYALPLAYATEWTTDHYISEGTTVDGKTYWYDHFEYQNEIYKWLNASVLDDEGRKEDIFHPLAVDSVALSDGMTAEEDDFGFPSFTGKKGDTITIRFHVQEEGIGNNLYLGFKDAGDHFSVTLDGKSLDMLSYWHSGIRGFGDTAGHRHVLTLRLKDDVTDLPIRTELYYEDLDVLKAYIEAIDRSGVKDLERMDGFAFELKGTLSIGDTAGKALLFTLPYEKGMQIFIDGKRMETVTRFNIFTSCALEGVEPGTHEVVLRYEDDGLKYGLLLSALGLAGLLAYGLFLVVGRRRRTAGI